jgi:eukaryotic-like serine/threonine-protein kinase
MTSTVLGEVVGSYQITGKIAEGGMGVVYRAQHQLLGKAAAVKLLLPELSSNTEIVNRFFTEARAATAVRHPGIVEVFDFGYMANGMAYIVMELLDGEPLSRRLATRGRMDDRTALLVIRGVASGLAAAHAKGIVHRDLKPDNIFLVPDPDMPGGERPKLLDFGIAKVAEAQRAGGASAKTRTGAVMGTPTYMSPEQCRGAGEVDHRSDIYSVGCILYEMVTGRPPFQAEGIGEIIGAHLFMNPEPPTRLVPTLGAATEGLIMHLLAKDPAHRVQSAAELARLLGQGSMPPSSLEHITAQTVAMKPLLTPAPTNRSYPGPGMPTGPGVPTTLSGAAAEAGGTMPPPGSKSKAGAFVALAVTLVGAGVAIAVGVGGGGGGGGTAPAPSAATAAPEPPPVSPPAPVVIVDAGTAVAVETLDAAPAVAVETPDAATSAGAAVAATGNGVGDGDSSSRSSSRRDKSRRDKSKPGDKSGTDKPGDTSGGAQDATGTGSATGKRIDRGD